MQTFVIVLPSPVLCVLVYRPPKYNADFIQEFSDFLSVIVTSFDNIVLLGDFNIHVCCQLKPLVTEFLNIDSFNFSHCVTGPAHYCV